MDGKELYEVFGLEANPEEKSAKPIYSEVRKANSEDSAGDDVTTGGADAEIENVTNMENEEHDESREHEGPDEEDENSKYAAARRKAERERDKAISKEREKHKEELDALVSQMGLKDMETGKLIQTKDEYDVYKKKLDGQKLDEALSKGQLKSKDIDKLVGERVETDPRVIEAQRVLEEVRRDKVRESINSDLDEIRKVNPGVKDFDDLKKLDKYGEISAMIRSGVPLGAAYFYVYRGEIAASASADAKAESEALKASVQKKEQEINVLKARDAKARSKGHLTSTVSRGTGAASVPKETLELYKSFMPGVSEEDIAKHYNKYLS